MTTSKIRYLLRTEMSEITRREAAKILGVSVRLVIQLENTGDICGRRDARGRVWYDRSAVEHLASARALAGHEEATILDLDDTGNYVLRRDVDPTNVVEDLAERRWRQELDVRERSLAQTERAIMIGERFVSLLTKHVPSVARAVERASWADVARAVVGAVPEEQRQRIIDEIADILGKQSQEKG